MDQSALMTRDAQTFHMSPHRSKLVAKSQFFPAKLACYCTAWQARLAQLAQHANHF